MALGIFIAVFGGLLATGFSVANTISKPELPALTAEAGNAEWVTALAIMLPIFSERRSGDVGLLYLATHGEEGMGWIQDAPFRHATSC